MEMSSVSKFKKYQIDFEKRIFSDINTLYTVHKHFDRFNLSGSKQRITKYTGWIVIDTDIYKYFYNKEHTYHCFFSKITGFTVRISDDIKNPDPEWCPLGPEILDLEISVNGCPKVGGHNCKFCYKNNSDKPATNMSFETFKSIVEKMPKCLYSIAFGITGVQTNPDFIKMLQYCRENDIVPNYTLSGADLNDTIIENTCKYCGAVAVSCYEGNKKLCYDTIKSFWDKSYHLLHINMHIVLSEDPIQLAHVWDVLKDIKDKKVEGLRNIVFLRIKPVGRAGHMNCKIHMDTYNKIMQYCFDNDIGFGFDSCSAKTAIKVLQNMGKAELTCSCEPCESSKFSSYINVHGEYWNCSFCERNPGIKCINVLETKDFSEVWNSDLCNKIRAIKLDRSCPIYDLDSND